MNAKPDWADVKYPPNQETVTSAVQTAIREWGGTWLPRPFLSNTPPDGYILNSDFQVIPEQSTVGDGITAIYHQARALEGTRANIAKWELVCLLTAVDNVTFDFSPVQNPPADPTCNVCGEVPPGLVAGFSLALKAHEDAHLNPVRRTSQDIRPTAFTWR